MPTPQLAPSLSDVDVANDAPGTGRESKYTVVPASSTNTAASDAAAIRVAVYQRRRRITFGGSATA